MTTTTFDQFLDEENQSSWTSENPVIKICAKDFKEMESISGFSTTYILIELEFYGILKDNCFQYSLTDLAYQFLNEGKQLDLRFLPFRFREKTQEILTKIVKNTQKKNCT